MKSGKLFGNVYVTPTGLKVGTRGKVRTVEEVLYSLPKGERRKVRKAARALGRYDVAGA